jgi:hypothetical protein
MWSAVKEENGYEAGVIEGLENILLEWFQQIHSVNVPISRPILCQKPSDIALCLKIYDFKASSVWLYRHLK